MAFFQYGGHLEPEIKLELSLRKMYQKQTENYMRH